MSDANDLIMGASVQGAKFETIGDLCQGEIVKIGDKQQSRKFRQDGKLGDLAFWDDGSPIWQVRIDVQTDVRDPAIQHDDGIRALHVRAGSDMKRAIQEGVRAAGVREILVGAFLGVQLVGTEQSGPLPAPNDKKLYNSVYRPPNPGSQMLMGGGAAQQPAMSPPAQWNGQAPAAAQQPVQPQQWAGQSVQPQQVQQWAQQPVVAAAQQMMPAAEQLQQAQQQFGIQQPNPTMQHANGQPGMQQPPANPANDPKVQALLAQVKQQ